MNEREKIALRKLSEENGLTKEDFYKAPQGFITVTRSGIEKIFFKNEFHVDYTLEAIQPNFAVVKSVITDKDGKELIQTYGSASEGNTPKHMNYYVEMAEKRALSRGVLKAIQAYQYGVMGEDELNTSGNG